MRKLWLLSLVLSGVAWPQQVSLDANSIVVTASRTLVLAPTDVSFNLSVNADVTTPTDQILATVDFGLTTDNLVSISSYPVGSMARPTRRGSPTLSG